MFAKMSLGIVEERDGMGGEKWELQMVVGVQLLVFVGSHDIRGFFCDLIWIVDLVVCVWGFCYSGLLGAQLLSMMLMMTVKKGGRKRLLRDECISSHEFRINKTPVWFQLLHLSISAIRFKWSGKFGREWGRIAAPCVVSFAQCLHCRWWYIRTSREWASPQKKVASWKESRDWRFYTPALRAVEPRFGRVHGCGQTISPSLYAQKYAIMPTM
jgi:hypothetical protein